MANLSGARVAGVIKYRAYVMDKDGHIAGFRAFVCGSDADATIWAKQLVDGHGVELWSGDRLVTRLDPPDVAVSHEVIGGRLVAKK